MRQKQQVRAPGSQAPRCTARKSHEIKPLAATGHAGSPPQEEASLRTFPKPFRHPAVSHAAQTFFG